MHDRVIDASPAIAYGSYHVFLMILVVAEQIQRQWVLSGLDVAYGLFK